jgi:hypothetical protein
MWYHYAALGITVILLYVISGISVWIEENKKK